MLENHEKGYNMVKKVCTIMHRLESDSMVDVIILSHTRHIMDAHSEGKDKIALS